MKRRQMLHRLLQASGGFIGGSLLASCDETFFSQAIRSTNLQPLFPLALLNPAQPLPQHVITPLSEFYVQSYGLPIAVKAENWKLEITGSVENPLTLSWQEIKAAASENFYLTMECIGNPAGGSQIGNALWTGTSLLPFLERARIQPETKEFVLQGADFYETTLPAAELMRREVYLVYQMNSAPLTKEHGYPVRIIIPGYYGQKQPKWLVEIKAIARSRQGYWERQGWSNTARIQTHSLVRQIQKTRVWNRQPNASLAKQGDRGWARGILIAGVALDAASPIQQVQISLDDGKTWQTADQNHPTSPHEWTLWRYLWHPTQSGQYTILARAQSQQALQPLDDRDERDGSAGVLKIQVNLDA